MSEVKNLTRCPWGRGCFQAARGREAERVRSPDSAHNCPKNQAKSLRRWARPSDDLLSIRRGTSDSNREIMAKTQSIPSRASTDYCGVPVSVEVCWVMACVNLR